MDITSVAGEFIEINQRRKELEKREDYLKTVLVRHFQETKTTHVETDKGKVSYIESQKVDYDIPALRQAIPEAVFNLVTKVSVNDAVLSQLIKDGKVDPKGIEQARRVTLMYRVVAQIPSGAVPAETSCPPRQVQPRQAPSVWEQAPGAPRPAAPRGRKGSNETPPAEGHSTRRPPGQTPSIPIPTSAKRGPAGTPTPSSKAPVKGTPESKRGRGGKAEPARREEKAGKQQRARNKS